MGEGGELRPGGLRIVLLGPPGSGKGTQAARLSEWGGVPTISTGEMLREAVDKGSELGRRVHDIMVTGELVDDATMTEVVRERLSAADAARGFVLDGFPRTLTQAGELDAILSSHGHRLDAVIAIEVPEAVLTQRTLSRQRADDKEAVIRERLRIYRSRTEPLVAHYRERGQLLAVNGNVPIEQVTSSILASLEAAN